MTVKVFSPKESGCGLPKKNWPFAVVLTTRKLAPASGRLITFISSVCASPLLPSSAVQAVKTYGQATGPELKSPDEAMSVWEKPKAIKSENNVRVIFLIIG